MLSGDDEFDLDVRLPDAGAHRRGTHRTHPPGCNDPTEGVCCTDDGEQTCATCNQQTCATCLTCNCTQGCMSRDSHACCETIG